MFVTMEDCEIRPAVGPQFITEVLGFEDRKLGIFFPPAKKKKQQHPGIYFISQIKVWKKLSATN